MARKKHDAQAAPGGIRLTGHPRARRQIRTAKGWGGLIAFLLVVKLSRGAALPWPDALERGLVGGVVGYVAAWTIAVTVWRHLALAELEQLRLRLVSTEQQATKAADAEPTVAAAQS
jgi:hypothetical protein